MTHTVTFTSQESKFRALKPEIFHTDMPVISW